MRLLERFLPEVKCPSEIPVMTSDNVKSPDVAWISVKRLKDVQGMPASTIAPEICVEIKSPSKTWKKLHEKAQLYFENEAKEVWFCNEEGKMMFDSAKKQLENSELIRDFPNLIELNLNE